MIKRPFAELRSALDARELRAYELAAAYLDRIEAPADLHAYAAVDRDGALAAAAAADRELDAGTRRGPLHGVPIGLKDNIPVTGMPTRYGTTVFDDLPPALDGATARAARAAGAVILGKHALHEVGMGDAVQEGPLANGVHPYNPDYVPGGSSSGSAVATAAGLCVLAIGGDSGGSVRNPAASCGVVGLKPTYGRIPTRGTMPFCWSIDTAGLFGRDVDTVAAGFAALVPGAGPVPVGRAPRLLFLPEDALGEVSPEVLAAYAAVREAFAAAGAELAPAPALDLDSAGPAWLGRVAEMYPVHAQRLATGAEFSASIMELLELSATTPVADYEASWETRRRLTAEVEAALEGFDALLTPANPYPGLRCEEWPGPKVFEWYRFCWPFNVTCQPGLTIPWTMSASTGLPLAYQLVARRGADEALLGAAAWCERQGSFDTTAAIR